MTDNQSTLLHYHAAGANFWKASRFGMMRFGKHLLFSFTKLVCHCLKDYCSCRQSGSTRPDSHSSTQFGRTVGRTVCLYLDLSACSQSGSEIYSAISSYLSSLSFGTAADS